MVFQVCSIPNTPHTVISLARVSHGIFEATLATGVTWIIDRERLMTVDQGAAKLITLEFRERAARQTSHSRASGGTHSDLVREAVRDQLPSGVSLSSTAQILPRPSTEPARLGFKSARLSIAWCYEYGLRPGDPTGCNTPVSSDSESDDESQHAQEQ